MFSSLLVCKFICLFVCLLAKLREHAWTGFHEIFRIYWARYRKQSEKNGGGMFKPLHTGLLFILFLGNLCLWATLRKNGWTDSHDIFRKVRTWGKEQSGIFSTCSGFNFFLGLCLSPTLWNNRWVDIHDIFRIWTQEGIGYTVSRLTRVFRVPKTRRGRGLRCRSASCFICLQVLYSK